MQYIETYLHILRTYYAKLQVRVFVTKQKQRAAVYPTYAVHRQQHPGPRSGSGEYLHETLQATARRGCK